jgi:heme exporter protein D
MAWASLAIAILSVLVALGAALFNRRAIDAEARDRKQQAADRREELDLRLQEMTVSSSKRGASRSAPSRPSVWN